MNNQDDQLHRLLQQWKGIEPASNFEAQVWRRIKVGTDRRAVRSPSFADWIRGWLPQPAFALSAAVVAGLVIGIGGGIFSAPVTRAPEQFSFLAPDTLASALRR